MGEKSSLVPKKLAYDIPGCFISRNFDQIVVFQIVSNPYSDSSLNKQPQQEENCYNTYYCNQVYNNGNDFRFVLEKVN